LICQTIESNDTKLKQESISFVTAFISQVNIEQQIRLLLDFIVKDWYILESLYKGASSLENDENIVTKVINSTQQMLQWDRDLQ